LGERRVTTRDEMEEAPAGPYASLCDWHLHPEGTRKQLRHDYNCASEKNVPQQYGELAGGIRDKRPGEAS